MGKAVRKVEYQPLTLTQALEFRVTLQRIVKLLKQYETYAHEFPGHAEAYTLAVGADFTLNALGVPQPLAGGIEPLRPPLKPSEGAD